MLERLSSASSYSPNSKLLKKLFLSWVDASLVDSFDEKSLKHFDWLLLKLGRK